MHFVYIDDSSDPPIYAFSALAIPASRWNDAFEGLKRWRRHLCDEHNISTRYELHATEFLSGRGSLGSLEMVSRHKRSQIFHKSFQVTEWLNRWEVRSFNVCHNGSQDRSFERLLNRINRTMQAWESHAHLICDEGKEARYTKMVRKMRVHNPIPSNQGVWSQTGDQFLNIPLDRIIEDPQFKKSERSYFIQQCDFMAYGLLRSEVPTRRAKALGITKSFDQLDRVLTPECNQSDPRRKGIIR